MLATAGPYRHKKQKKENQQKNLCLNIRIKRTPYDPRSHKRYRPVHLFYITYTGRYLFDIFRNSI